MAPATPGDRATRRRWLDQLGDLDAHARVLAKTPDLARIQVRGATTATGSAARSLRIVAWNMERGTHLDAQADVLEAAGADVVLATELDVGMARSDNRDTPGELASRVLGTAAFGIEFVELGLGNAAEQEQASGRENDVGWHGNAIVSRLALRATELVRIEADGSWFRSDSPEPRVGGRMAVLATVDLEGPSGPIAVTLCSVHLESESDPELRARQMAIVLDAVDRHASGGPAVVGGDLNTFSCSLDDLRHDHSRLHEDDPARWAWPVPYEPLFDDAARRGYEIESANRREQTVRLAAEQRPGTLPRLDWLLVRGLDVSDPVTIPAVGADGTVLTDHDAVAVTVSVAASVASP